MNISKHNLITVNSISAATVLLLHFFNGVIGISGASAITVGIVFLLTGISIFIYKNYTIDIRALLIVFGIIFSFLLSMMFVKDTTVTTQYFMNFLFFSIIALWVGMQEIDYLLTLRIIQNVGLLGIIVCDLRGYDGVSYGMRMGSSYAMLPLLLAACIILFCDEKKKYKFIALINIFLVLKQYVQIAPRGPFLTVLIFCCLWLLYLTFRNKKNYLLKRIFILSCTGIAIYLVLNLDVVIIAMNDFMRNTFGLKIYAFEKYAYYLSQGEVLNGRDEIWNLAKNTIAKNPITGMGIGYLEMQNQGSHAHNLIVQAFCEAGIIFGVPICILIAKCLKLVLQESHKHDRMFMLYCIFVISVGLVMLFFSSAYWLWVPFWYLIGFVIKRKKTV